MLKRVKTEELSLGMYVHKLEGPWMSHPFWRTKFVLEDPDQLAKLRESEVEWVQIDVSKGSDVGLAHAPARPAVDDGRRNQVLERARLSREDRVAPSVRAAPQAFDPLSKAPRSFGAELSTANALAARSAKVIHAIFGQARLGKAVKAAMLEPLVEEISSSVQRNPHAFTGITRLKKNSEYLYIHSLSICALMINFAQQLKMGPEQTRQAGLAGMLMDIGMGHVPPEIYDKEGALTEDEERIVQSHTTLAQEFLQLGGDMPDAVLDVCLHHHERVDGSGYPHGLTGDNISLFARMAAICDTYDAMTSRRPHKAGRDPSSVLIEMGKMNSKLDQALLEVFIRGVGIYPIGSLVRLESQRLAVVCDQNMHDLTLPRVRAFYSIPDGSFVKPVELDLANSFGKDAIVARENPEDWPIDDWDSLCIRLVEKMARVI
jgi:HD-GYP domain-containing protein (c-di-GMP phosphodiesterase class II)